MARDTVLSNQSGKTSDLVFSGKNGKQAGSEALSSDLAEEGAFLVFVQTERTWRIS